jgi:hypothetical protein
MQYPWLLISRPLLWLQLEIDAGSVKRALVAAPKLKIKADNIRWALAHVWYVVLLVCRYVSGYFCVGDRIEVVSRG